jgi:hypothetical protein
MSEAALHTGNERAMQSHGLGGIFDAAGHSQAAVRAQWIVGRPVRGAAAADVALVPVEDLVEQAHAAAMRDARLDPCTVQGHGAVQWHGSM